MPFHDGAYYPYTGDTLGTHSSAGNQFLLNSPLSQPSVSGHPAPGMTASSGASAVLPFKFRARRESVDWRRINAVDVDLVVSQLDLDTLQEHIGSVTFCSLDGERCQRCQSPVDPALVKLLRLAQLMVEWILHCQEFLTHNLRAMEEQVAAAGREREQLLAQQKEQEEKMKTMTAELKHRKKCIRNQQRMLVPQNSSGEKCPHCDKSFLNASFLQSHMQRRHPDEYDIEFRSDSEMKSQIESLKSENSGLKEQIVQQQLDLQAKTAQEREQQSLQKDLLREQERFKAEEMARNDRKIEDIRESMRKEMEFLYTRNIQALNEANQNQTGRHETPASPVHSQPERDLDNYREMHTQAIQKLEQQLKKQDKKWGSMLQEMKAQHESEKNQLLNELSGMQSSMSEQQESNRRLQQESNRRLQQESNQQLQKEMDRRLQEIKAQHESEKNQLLNELSGMQSSMSKRHESNRRLQQEMKQTVKAQREQIKNINSTPPTKIVDVPDSSSFSERRPGPAPEKKPVVTAGPLKRNPNIKKEIRLNLEQAVIKKLEKLGVKSDQSGLKAPQFSAIQAKLNSERERVAERTPDYWRQREEIVRTMEQKLAVQRRASNSAPKSKTRSGQSVQALQIRPRSRSSSLPSRATQVVSGPAVKQLQTPQPAPRIRTTAQPKTSTPKTALRTFTSKTPPFSSDEEYEEEDTDMEEERHPKHQRGKSSQPTLNQVQVRASNASPVQSRQAQARQSFASNSQQARGSVGGATATAVAKLESDEDEWSEVSELQEIVDPKRLQSFKDQNGNVDKRSFGKENKINDLARKMEKQFAERAVKKPAGGVSILPERNDEVQELTYTDLEESSAWAGSSLEDRRETAKPAKDSPSTSVWGTSTGKGAKSGLTEAGTGSTLKSSLCSLSDISDSEDISNR
ncbi:hypothetical protein VZT92_017956 [Zoarces viviparus]|uniref:C2H2-type domain-containing protein n=1 Tax=Zoarces viviparus TaxID=48416 RepID=A0AAW1EMY7_ZOAVI